MSNTSVHTWKKNVWRREAGSWSLLKGRTVKTGSPAIIKVIQLVSVLKGLQVYYYHKTFTGPPEVTQGYSRKLKKIKSSIILSTSIDNLVQVAVNFQKDVSYREGKKFLKMSKTMLFLWFITTIIITTIIIKKTFTSFQLLDKALAKNIHIYWHKKTEGSKN